MSKVLIIGANGYFGSRLFEYLRKKKIDCDGCDINYFKNCNLFKKNNKKIIFSCASNLDENFLKKYKIVIAFAGFSNNPIFKKKERHFHNNEYKFLTKIAKICKKKAIRFIFPSSCSLYGKALEKKLLNEKSKLNPITHYSKNKRKVEKYLIKISDKKFRPIILRFSTLYGISEKMRFDIVINMFCGSAITSKKIELNSDGLVYRPFLEISDACNAVYKVLLKKGYVKEQIFNVGSNKDNFRIIDVAKMINKKIYNSKIIFLKENKKLITDNLIKKGKDKRNYKVDFSKFCKTYNFKVNYNLKDGINKLLIDLKKLRLSKSEFNSIKFYRLQYLKNLIYLKKLDKNFQWKR